MKPYVIDGGHKRLILQPLDKERSSLMIEAFGAGQTILLSKAEMIALAFSLTNHARGK